jgi:predicted HicB family RNase H-like nuclease
MENKKEEQKTKRLVVDLDESLHLEIKKQALFRNSSIKKYIIEAVIERMKQDAKYQ